MVRKWVASLARVARWALGASFLVPVVSGLGAPVILPESPTEETQEPVAGPDLSPLPTGPEDPCSLPNQCLAWINKYDLRSRLEVAQAAVVSPGGDLVLVAGHTGEAPSRASPMSVAIGEVYSPSSDAFAAAYRSDNGGRVWLSRYEGHGPDLLWDAAVAPDGSRFYVAGATETENSTSQQFDGLLIAYDATSGREAWVSPIDTGYVEHFWAVAVSPDGATVYAAGYSLGQGIFVVAVDARTGALQWQSVPCSGFAEDIAVSPDGDQVFIAGFAFDDNARGYYVAALNASSGALNWDLRYDPSKTGSGGDASARSIAVAPDGRRVYTQGWVSQESTGSDYGTYAFDASTGEIVWQRFFDGPSHKNDGQFSGSAGIALSPDGRVAYVTGSVSLQYASQGPATGPDGHNTAFGTLAYDAETGETIWSAFYDPPMQSWDAGFAVLAGPEGQRVYVAGYSWGVGQYDYTLVAYEAGTGAQAWERRYDGTVHSWDLVRDAAIVPDGSRIFLTGASFEQPFAPGTPCVPCDVSALTVAYDSDLPPMEARDEPGGFLGLPAPPPAQAAPAAEAVPGVVGGIIGVLGGAMILRLLLGGRRTPASAPSLMGRK